MIDACTPDYSNTPASDQRPEFGYAPADPTAPPCVTILTPYWNNAAPVFEETARSVFRQSLQQWEWLIVNDCTTDPQALRLLDSYRNRDPRIRVIDNRENLGLAGSRNVGFKAARADFVFLLDDDDMLEPTALEEMWWFLLSYPEYAAVSGYEVGFGAKQYLWPTGFVAGEKNLTANSVSGRALVRRSAHAKVGGYDASIREGMEDWEFWLRLANAGLWGGTIPEYLDWYRTRPNHTSRWGDIDDPTRFEAFIQRLRKKYAKVFNGGFPRIQPAWPQAMDPVRRNVPPINRLAKTKPRLLMIVPWLAMGGADKFNLDLVEQLRHRGWEVTLVCALPSDNSWGAEFTRLTPDVFIPHNFVKATDRPAFIRHLIDSRSPDVVMITNSELGYQFLPYLRAFCPGPAYVDCCHSEQELWKNGGYPRWAVGYQTQLDLNIVTSAHLKDWMTARGARPERIEVAYSNVDASLWKPDAGKRASVRAEYGIPADRAVVVLVGRLCADKQPKVFARTMRRLLERKVDFAALVVGDGPDRAFLEETFREAQFEGRVNMLGAPPTPRVREVMAAGDIFFLPSRSEGIAVTLFEAMASELAVVAADVGGQRELVTPDCGLLLPRSDEETESARYAEALAELIADPARRRAMGKQGRRRICERFNLNEMGSRMLALFAQAAKAKAASVAVRLPEDLAVELATQAVEFSRLSEVADDVWNERAHLAAACESQQQEVARLQEAREWFLSQISTLEEEVSVWRANHAEVRGWATELEKAKTYFLSEVESQRKRIEDLEASRAADLDKCDSWRRIWTRRVLRLPNRVSRLIGRRGVAK